MTQPSATTSRQTSSTTPNLEEKPLAATQMTETTPAAAMPNPHITKRRSQVSQAGR